MIRVISGTACVLGDFIAADAILPARHSFLPPAEMAAHVLEELGAAVTARVRAHPILVVGEGFGYGTGRESPARALRAAGVRAIVGPSFARMFYRNALNNGILPVERAGLRIAEGDAVEIDTQAGELRHEGQTLAIAPIPPLFAEILSAGNLIEHGRRVLAANAR